MFTVGWETAPLYESEVCMKAVVKVDIVDGKCVVIYSDGSEQELYEYPSDEGGGGDVSLMDEKLISQNGVYSASSDGYDGYKKVNVKVVAPAPILKRINVTENGVYKASDYNAYGFEQVVVDVPTGGVTISDFLSGNYPAGAFDVTGYVLKPFALAGCSNLARVIGTIATNSSLKKPTNILQNSNVSSINIKLEAAASGGTFNNIFSSSPELTTAVLEVEGANPFTGIFTSCTKLKTADFNLQKIRTNTFAYDTALDTLILRRTDDITTLENVAVFGNTKFKNGGSGGTIYVPSALMSTYKNAPQWSTLDGYGTVTWLSIEGSHYETYYADETPIT